MRTYFIGFIVIASLFFSCTKEHSKEYTTISGLIANNTASKIIVNGRGFKKEIAINDDGTFKDTLKVLSTGFHNFFDGKNKTRLFLKNGSDIKINYTYNDFKKTLSFAGNGSETSAYLINKEKYDKVVNLRRSKKYYQLDKSAFNAKMNEIEDKFNEMLAVNVDSALKANEIKKNKKSLDYVKKHYPQQHKLLTVLAKGKVSPKFVNYENFNGGTTSLDDFKGKYVYIDVWATWCGPCKREIPSFKKVMEEYKGKKNIAFVGISVDDPRRHGSVEKAKAKWRAMVKEKNMVGVQLFADNAWASTFVRAYGITGIPRFLLIDPNGNIVSSNAPRPSQLALKTLFDSLM